MRSLDARLARRAPGTYRRLGGETILIRRSSTIESVKGGTVSRELALAVDAAEDAETIALRLPDSTVLKGSILAGTTLQIAGNHYKVTATVVAAPAATTLPTVALDPPLLAAAAAGAVVTISSGPVYTWTDGLVIGDSKRDEGADVGGEVTLIVSLLKKGAAITPIAGDSIERPGTGFVGRISEVPESVGAAWDVKAGPSTGQRQSGAR